MRLAILAALAFAAAAAAQSTLVIPAVAAAADGNSSTSYPFDVATGRMLYVYDSTHFTNNGVNQAVLISQIRLRANASTTTWAGSSMALQMDLSTAAVDYTGISTTWNSNHGPDRTTVFNATATIAAGTSTAGTPGPFHVTVPVSPPFLYNPLLGDLVIDTTHSGLTIANTPTMDCVTTAGVANAKRVYSLTNPPAATATLWSGDLANVLEFTYVPAAGANAAFVANVTSGVSPLAVNFTDQSVTSAPGGITSWAWDFDGDSVVDSTLQNPSYTYASCGNFTVSLTVNDGVNPPSTLTRVNMVRTDDLVANFTSTVIGAYTVQFTDLSAPAATSWAWDFNGDSVIDSTAQNPVWVFPNGSPTPVSLTVTRNCKTSVKLVQFTPTQQLSTNLTANNSVGTPATVYYDLVVTNPLGITINALDSVSTTLNAAFTIDIFLKVGTYVGSELNPAPWTNVATAAGTTAAVAGTPFVAALAQPLYVPPGAYGVAMRYVGATVRYVTLTAPTTYSNGDLGITLGAASLSTAGPFTGTNLNSPRGWSGTIYYESTNITGKAGHGWFGPGCAGSLGVPRQNCTARPIVGSTMSIDNTNVPYGIGVMIVGVSNTISGFGPLPVDLTFLGMTGCPLRVSLDVTDTVVGAGTTVAWNFAIPNNPALVGAQFFNQLAALDTVNAFGFVTGDAAGWVLGSN